MLYLRPTSTKIYQKSTNTHPHPPTPPKNARHLGNEGSPIQKTHFLTFNKFPAVLKAKIQIKNPRIRSGISPKPTMSLGTWQSGPSPGTPRAKENIKNHFKHSQVISAELKPCCTYGQQVPESTKNQPTTTPTSPTPPKMRGTSGTREAQFKKLTF